VSHCENFVENWQRNCPKTKNCLKLWSNFFQNNYFFLKFWGMFSKKTGKPVCVCVFFPGKSDVTFVGNKYIASCFEQDIRSFCKMFVENS
jgi:hypothetical protein